MEQRLQELKEEIEKAKRINKEIRQVKRKEKALDKLIKLAKKYNLELTRDDKRIIVRFYKTEK